MEKKLNCTFIRINTSKENYDVDYEASRIQTFISQFKDNENKKLEDEIEKLKLQLANLSVKNNKLVLISKNKIKGKSRCTICLTERSFIDEVKYDLEKCIRNLSSVFY